MPKTQYKSVQNAKENVFLGFSYICDHSLTKVSALALMSWQRCGNVYRALVALFEKPRETVSARCSYSKMPLQSKRKRKGFRGTQFQAMKAPRAPQIVNPRAAVREAVAVAAVDAATQRAPPSMPAATHPEGSSARKLSSVPSAWKDIAGPPETPLDDLDQPHYRIVNIGTLLKAMLAFLVCSFCHRKDYTIKEDYNKRKGFCSRLVLICKSCEREHSFPTSEIRPPDSKGGQSHDVNRRAVLACLAMGSGRANFHRFCGIFNMPPLIAQDSWKNHMKAISEASEKVFEESASHAVQEYRKSQNAQEGEVIDAAVSYDGTWAKRGHSSHYGVQAAVLNGCVVDFQLLCTYCRACQRKDESGVDKNSIEYLNWYRKHHPVCQKNYKGSAASMEAKGATAVFGRSVEKHKLRYTTFIGDGDSKAFNEVENIYGQGKEVRKLDCVGHVHKRMGTNLRKYVDASKRLVMEDGGSVGGKGRLTKVAMNRLGTYYGYAIKRNLGNVAAMKRDILAVLYHSCRPKNVDDAMRKKSTKKPSDGHVHNHDSCPKSEAEQHQYCPVGEHSWCRWQKDQATGENKYKQDANRTLPHCFFHELLGLFERLSDESLLERCKDGHTQNSNESFHNTLWTYAPKAKYRGSLSIMIAARIAGAQFNNGSTAFARILEEMRCPPGKYSFEHFQKIDAKRISASKAKASVEVKKKRAKRRIHKAQRQDHLERREGPTYEAGGFGGEEPPERPRQQQAMSRGRRRKGKELATAPVRRRREPTPAAESSSEDEAPVPPPRQSRRRRYQGKTIFF